MSTTLEHPPLADLVAENHRRWTAISQTADALEAIKWAADEAIAAEPVLVTLTRIKPDGEAVTREVPFVDGEPGGDSEDLQVCLYIVSALNRMGRADALTELDAEMWQRFKEGERASKERAAAIRVRVYCERGYDAALIARDRAWNAVNAIDERLFNAPIRTMADAIAALEHLKQLDEWRPLGDRVIAFLQGQAV